MKSTIVHPGVDLAKDKDQRIRQVADMRKATNRAERQRRQHAEAKEHLEIYENVERAWNKQGQGFGCDIFSGIGECVGFPGGSGRKRWDREAQEWVQA
jgi:hypothetical protein